jgi:hypothetical protein
MTGLAAFPARADSTFRFTYPKTAMQVNSTTGGGARYLTTLTQRAASEIPLVFGINVVGGNMFNGIQCLAGTLVNENPDPYIWNYNYIVRALDIDTSAVMLPAASMPIVASNTLLPAGSFYRPLPNPGGGSQGLYQSGGATNIYVTPVDEVGGVGYAAGYRSDVVIGFEPALVDQIDLVRSWKPGDAFYQAGDENYSPLILDVQTGSATARLYTWLEMAKALDAYIARHPGLTLRYGSATPIAARLAEFSAGIPYYIASLIADGTLKKKTAAYVSNIDQFTLTCIKPGGYGNGVVRFDSYAQANNFNYVVGSHTLTELMNLGIDVLIVGTSPVARSGGGGGGGGGGGNRGGGGAASQTNKLAILTDLARLGYKPEQVPLVMDSMTDNVTIGTNGYNFAPTTPLLTPYIQVYAYMDALEKVNPAINPVAMFQFAVDEFMHITDASAADVALFYIASKWDSVDAEYDRVPDLVHYKYDKTAIVTAIKKGIAYAISGKAAINGNTLVPAYRSSEANVGGDAAHTLLTRNATTTLPASGHRHITVRIDGQNKYLDLTALAGDSEKGTRYQAIVDHYNSGQYGYGDDLQITLQNYADRMVYHVWQPDTNIPGSYAYGMNAAKDYKDVKGLPRRD